MPGKTGGSLKSIFDPAMKAAAAQQMEPVLQAQERAQPGAGRNRKAGGRGVRVSGYIPADLDEALRDEVVKRTVAERRAVSFNDVLCEALAAWKQTRSAAE